MNAALWSSLMPSLPSDKGIAYSMCLSGSLPYIPLLLSLSKPPFSKLTQEEKASHQLDDGQSVARIHPRQLELCMCLLHSRIENMPCPSCQALALAAAWSSNRRSAASPKEVRRISLMRLHLHSSSSFIDALEVLSCVSRLYFACLVSSNLK